MATLVAELPCDNRSNFSVDELAVLGIARLPAAAPSDLPEESESDGFAAEEPVEPPFRNPNTFCLTLMSTPLVRVGRRFAMRGPLSDSWNNTRPDSSAISMSSKKLL